jgi:uncharacterized membrane protein YeaQ/YmgE (transglycosylase-associated protein family)
METFISRTISVVLEVTILMAVIGSLFAGAKFAIFDFGTDQKYSQFIKLVMMILGCVALVFFAAHLITFYPRLLSHV